MTDITPEEYADQLHRLYPDMTIANIKSYRTRYSCSLVEARDALYAARARAEQKAAGTLPGVASRTEYALQVHDRDSDEEWRTLDPSTTDRSYAIERLTFKQGREKSLEYRLVQRVVTDWYPAK
jgi:Ni/Co efflux regulator RcnB